MCICYKTFADWPTDPLCMSNQGQNPGVKMCQGKYRIFKKRPRKKHSNSNIRDLKKLPPSTTAIVHTWKLCTWVGTNRQRSRVWRAGPRGWRGPGQCHRWDPQWTWPGRRSGWTAACKCWLQIGKRKIQWTEGRTSDEPETYSPCPLPGFTGIQFRPSWGTENVSGLTELCSWWYSVKLLLWSSPAVLWLMQYAYNSFCCPLPAAVRSEDFPSLVMSHTLASRQADVQTAIPLLCSPIVLNSRFKTIGGWRSFLQS